MDYLTKFYKNQSEVLAEQVKALEAQLEHLIESEAPASTFSGTGAGQQRFSDAELEKQMFRHKRTGFFGAEVPDEKQSREYLDAKAELERRRGAAKQAPAQTQAPAPTQAPSPVQRTAPRPPVEQMGPVGSPSAVPTRTEVQRTQAVADKTQTPTALPTNTAPGTMHMTDMDGNPIAVQPKAPKMDPVEFAAHAAEAGGDYKKDKSGYIQSRVEPEVNYTSYNVQKSIPGKPPASSTPAGAAGMISRAFSVPSVAPGTVQKPSDIHGGRLQPGFHDGRIEPKVDADVQAADKPGRWAGDWNTFINSMRPQTSAQPPVPTSLYGTPPSAQFAPTDSSLTTINPQIGEPVKPSEIKNTPRPDQAAIDSAARQALPSAARDAIKAPAEEDFSKFWAGKPRYGDLELQNMMRQFKKTSFPNKELPLERQPVEYRAARAELMRRGKLK